MMDNVVRRARNDELPGSEFVVTATFQPKIVELNTNFVFLNARVTNLNPNMDPALLVVLFAPEYTMRERYIPGCLT